MGGPVLVGGAVVGGEVVGGAVVGGAVVGGAVAVVGGTLGLGVGVTLTSDVVMGSIMAVLPLPLATKEVVLSRLLAVGRLVLVVGLGMVVGLGVVVGLGMVVGMRELVIDWPRQERRKKQDTDSV